MAVIGKDPKRLGNEFIYKPASCCNIIQNTIHFCFVYSMEMHCVSM